MKGLGGGLELKGQDEGAALPLPTYLRPPERGLRVGGSGLRAGRSKIFSNIPADPIPHPRLRGFLSPYFLLDKRF